MSQGRPVTQGSRLVAIAIDRATKNALADIVIDRIKLSIGDESEATDERIIAELQAWFDPIARVRGDARIDFLAVAKRRLENDERYRRRVIDAE